MTDIFKCENAAIRADIFSADLKNTEMKYVKSVVMFIYHR